MNNQNAIDNGDVREQLGTIMEDIRGLGRQLRHVTSSQLHNVGDRAKAVGDSVGGMVREKPLSALLVAVGVGALVGMVWGRR